MRTLLAFLVLAAPAAAQEATPLIPDRAPPELGGTAFSRTGGALDGAEPRQALAAATEDETRRAILTALVPRGCRIRESEVEAVFAPLGFSFEDVSKTFTDLLVSGALLEDSRGGELVIPASLCPPDQPAPSPKDRVIEAFRASGCVLSEEAFEADTVLSALSENQRQAILGPMAERGEIEIGDREATLSEALCRAD